MMDFAETLDSLRLSGNLRSIPRHTLGGSLLDFSTNDYLGLALRQDLQQEFLSQADGADYALTSSASRLLASNQNAYSRLEELLENLYGRPALIFNSGYHANTGLVSAIADKHTLIAADRLVHASIIDGIMLSGATMRRWRHNDYEHLLRILEKESSGYNRVLIIVESIYSMDGDAADLERLIEIKHRFPKALLYVDEAHAVGACGNQGLGLGHSLPDDLFSLIDITVGTFGKACASSGAFAVMNSTLRSYILNKARSFIFSTVLPPICCEWTRFLIERIVTMDSEREHLRRLSARLAEQLAEAGLLFGEPSHIVPVMIGDAGRALAVAERLLERGIKVLPIRTPTVPPGTERLRISLSAANTFDQIDMLADALKESL